MKSHHFIILPLLLFFTLVIAAANATTDPCSSMSQGLVVMLSSDGNTASLIYDPQNDTSITAGSTDAFRYINCVAKAAADASSTVLYSFEPKSLATIETSLDLTLTDTTVAPDKDVAYVQVLVDPTSIAIVNAENVEFTYKVDAPLNESNNSTSATFTNVKLNAYSVTAYTATFAQTEFAGNATPTTVSAVALSMIDPVFSQTNAVSVQDSALSISFSEGFSGTKLVKRLTLEYSSATTSISIPTANVQVQEVQINNLRSTDSIDLLKGLSVKASSSSTPGRPASLSFSNVCPAAFKTPDGSSSPWGLADAGSDLSIAYATDCGGVVVGHLPALVANDNLSNQSVKVSTYGGPGPSLVAAFASYTQYAGPSFLDVVQDMLDDGMAENTALATADPNGSTFDFVDTTQLAALQSFGVNGNNSTLTASYAGGTELVLTDTADYGLVTLRAPVQQVSVQPAAGQSITVYGFEATSAGALNLNTTATGSTIVCSHDLSITSLATVYGSGLSIVGDTIVDGTLNVKQDAVMTIDSGLLTTTLAESNISVETGATLDVSAAGVHIVAMLQVAAGGTFNVGSTVASLTVHTSIALGASGVGNEAAFNIQAPLYVGAVNDVTPATAQFYGTATVDLVAKSITTACFLDAVHMPRGALVINGLQVKDVHAPQVVGNTIKTTAATELVAAHAGDTLSLSLTNAVLANIGQTNSADPCNPDSVVLSQVVFTNTDNTADVLYVPSCPVSLTAPFGVLAEDLASFAIYGNINAAPLTANYTASDTQLYAPRLSIVGDMVSTGSTSLIGFDVLANSMDVQSGSALALANSRVYQVTCSDVSGCSITADASSAVQQLSNYATVTFTGGQLAVVHATDTVISITDSGAVLLKRTFVGPNGTVERVQSFAQYGFDDDVYAAVTADLSNLAAVDATKVTSALNRCVLPFLVSLTGDVYSAESPPPPMYLMGCSANLVGTTQNLYDGSNMSLQWLTNTALTPLVNVTMVYTNVVTLSEVSADTLTWAALTTFSDETGTDFRNLSIMGGTVARAWNVAVLPDYSAPVPQQPNAGCINLVTTGPNTNVAAVNYVSYVPGADYLGNLSVLDQATVSNAGQFPCTVTVYNGVVQQGTQAYTANCNYCQTNQALTPPDPDWGSGLIVMDAGSVVRDVTLTHGWVDASGGGLIVNLDHQVHSASFSANNCTLVNTRTASGSVTIVQSRLKAAESSLVQGGIALSWYSRGVAVSTAYDVAVAISDSTADGGIVTDGALPNSYHPSAAFTLTNVTTPDGVSGGYGGFVDITGSACSAVNVTMTGVDLKGKVDKGSSDYYSVWLENVATFVLDDNSYVESPLRADGDSVSVTHLTAATNTSLSVYSCTGQTSQAVTLSSLSVPNGNVHVYSTSSTVTADDNDLSTGSVTVDDGVLSSHNSIASAFTAASIDVLELKKSVDNSNIAVTVTGAAANATLVSLTAETDSDANVPYFTYSGTATLALHCSLTAPDRCKFAGDLAQDLQDLETDRAVYAIPHAHVKHSVTSVDSKSLHTTTAVLDTISGSQEWSSDVTIHTNSTVTASKLKTVTMVNDTDSIVLELDSASQVDNISGTGHAARLLGGSHLNAGAAATLTNLLLDASFIGAIDPAPATTVTVTAGPFVAQNESIVTNTAITSQITPVSAGADEIEALGTTDPCETNAVIFDHSTLAADSSVTSDYNVIIRNNSTILGTITTTNANGCGKIEISGTNDIQGTLTAAAGLLATGGLSAGSITADSVDVSGGDISITGAVSATNGVSIDGSSGSSCSINGDVSSTDTSTSATMVITNCDMNNHAVAVASPSASVTLTNLLQVTTVTTLRGTLDNVSMSGSVLRPSGTTGLAGAVTLQGGTVVGGDVPAAPSDLTCTDATVNGNSGITSADFTYTKCQVPNAAVQLTGAFVYVASGNSGDQLLAKSISAANSGIMGAQSITTTATAADLAGTPSLQLGGNSDLISPSISSGVTVSTGDLSVENPNILGATRVTAGKFAALQTEGGACAIEGDIQAAAGGVSIEGVSLSERCLLTPPANATEPAITMTGTGDLVLRNVADGDGVAGVPAKLYLASASIQQLTLENNSLSSTDLTSTLTAVSCSLIDSDVTVVTTVSCGSASLSSTSTNTVSGLTVTDGTLTASHYEISPGGLDCQVGVTNSTLTNMVVEGTATIRSPISLDSNNFNSVVTVYKADGATFHANTFSTQVEGNSFSLNCDSPTSVVTSNHDNFPVGMSTSCALALTGANLPSSQTITSTGTAIVLDGDDSTVNGSLRTTAAGSVTCTGTFTLGSPYIDTSNVDDITSRGDLTLNGCSAVDTTTITAGTLHNSGSTITLGSTETAVAVDAFATDVTSGQVTVYGTISAATNSTLSTLVHVTSTVSANANLDVSTDGTVDSDVTVTDDLSIAAGTKSAFEVGGDLTSSTGAISGASVSASGLIQASTGLLITGDALAGGNISVSAGSVSVSGLAQGSTLSASAAVSAGTLSSTASVTAGTSVFGDTSVQAAGDVVASNGDVTSNGVVSASSVSASGLIRGSTVSASSSSLYGATLSASSGFLYAASNLVASVGDVLASSYVFAGTQVSSAGAIAASSVSSGGLIAATDDITSGDFVYATTALTVSSGSISATGLVHGSTISASGSVGGSDVVASDGLLISGSSVSAAGLISASAGVSATGLILGSTLTSPSAIIGGASITITGDVTSGTTLSAAGNISAASITGSDSVLSGIALTATSGGIVGGSTISSASLIQSAAAISAAGLLQSGSTITAVGDISAATMSSSSAILSDANITSTVQVIAGSSVQALSGLIAVANLSASGMVYGSTISASGSLLSGGNVSAVGLLFGSTLSAEGMLSGSTVSSASTITSGSGWVVADGPLVAGDTVATGGTISCGTADVAGNILSGWQLSCSGLVHGSTISAASTITTGSLSATGLLTSGSTISSSADISAYRVLATGDVTAATGIVADVVIQAGGQVATSSGPISASSVSAAGLVSAESITTTSDFLVSGSSISSATGIDAATSITAVNDVVATDGDITAVGNIRITGVGSLQAVTGLIDAGITSGSINVSQGNVEVAGDITAKGLVQGSTLSSSLVFGKSITIGTLGVSVQASISSAGLVQSGGNVTAVGSVTSAGVSAVGSSVVVGSSLSASGDVVAGSISAAGMLRGATLSAGSGSIVSKDTIAATIMAVASGDIEATYSIDAPVILGGGDLTAGSYVHAATSVSTAGLLQAVGGLVSPSVFAGTGVTVTPSLQFTSEAFSESFPTDGDIIADSVISPGAISASGLIAASTISSTSGAITAGSSISAASLVWSGSSISAAGMVTALNLTAVTGVSMSSLSSTGSVVVTEGTLTSSSGGISVNNVSVYGLTTSATWLVSGSSPTTCTLTGGLVTGDYVSLTDCAVSGGLFNVASSSTPATQLSEIVDSTISYITSAVYGNLSVSGSSFSSTTDPLFVHGGSFTMSGTSSISGGLRVTNENSVGGDVTIGTGGSVVGPITDFTYTIYTDGNVSVTGSSVTGGGIKSTAGTVSVLQPEAVGGDLEAYNLVTFHGPDAFNSTFTYSHSVTSENDGFDCTNVHMTSGTLTVHGPLTLRNCQIDQTIQGTITSVYVSPGTTFTTDGTFHGPCTFTDFDNSAALTTFTNGLTCDGSITIIGSPTNRGTISNGGNSTVPVLRLNDVDANSDLYMTITNMVLQGYVEVPARTVVRLSNVDLNGYAINYVNGTGLPGEVVLNDGTQVQSITGGEYAGTVSLDHSYIGTAETPGTVDVSGPVTLANNSTVYVTTVSSTSGLSQVTDYSALVASDGISVASLWIDDTSSVTGDVTTTDTSSCVNGQLQVGGTLTGSATVAGDLVFNPGYSISGAAIMTNVCKFTQTGSTPTSSVGRLVINGQLDVTDTVHVSGSDSCNAITFKALPVDGTTSASAVNALKVSSPLTVTVAGTFNCNTSNQALITVESISRTGTWRAGFPISVDFTDTTVVLKSTRFGSVASVNSLTLLLNTHGTLAPSVQRTHLDGDPNNGSMVIFDDKTLYIDSDLARIDETTMREYIYTIENTTDGTLLTTITITRSDTDLSAVLLSDVVVTPTWLTSLYIQADTVRVGPLMAPQMTLYPRGQDFTLVGSDQKQNTFKGLTATTSTGAIDLSSAYATFSDRVFVNAACRSSHNVYGKGVEYLQAARVTADSYFDTDTFGSNDCSVFRQNVKFAGVINLSCMEYYADVLDTVSAAFVLDADTNVHATGAGSGTSKPFIWAQASASSFDHAVSSVVYVPEGVTGYTSLFKYGRALSGEFEGQATNGTLATWNIADIWLTRGPTTFVALMGVNSVGMNTLGVTLDVSNMLSTTQLNQHPLTQIKTLFGDRYNKNTPQQLAQGVLVYDSTSSVHDVEVTAADTRLSTIQTLLTSDLEANTRIVLRNTDTVTVTISGASLAQFVPNTDKSGFVSFVLSGSSKAPVVLENWTQPEITAVVEALQEKEVKHVLRNTVFAAYDINCSVELDGVSTVRSSVVDGYLANLSIAMSSNLCTTVFSGINTIAGMLDLDMSYGNIVRNPGSKVVLGSADDSTVLALGATYESSLNQCISVSSSSPHTKQITVDLGEIDTRQSDCAQLVVMQSGTQYIGLRVSLLTTDVTLEILRNRITDSMSSSTSGTAYRSVGLVYFTAPLLVSQPPPADADVVLYVTEQIYHLSMADSTSRLQGAVSTTLPADQVAVTIVTFNQEQYGCKRSGVYAANNIRQRADVTEGDRCLPALTGASTVWGSAFSDMVGNYTTTTSTVAFAQDGDNVTLSIDFSLFDTTLVQPWRDVTYGVPAASLCPPPSTGTQFDSCQAKLSSPGTYFDSSTSSAPPALGTASPASLYTSAVPSTQYFQSDEYFNTQVSQVAAEAPGWTKSEYVGQLSSRRASFAYSGSSTSLLIDMVDGNGNKVFTRTTDTTLDTITYTTAVVTGVLMPQQTDLVADYTPTASNSYFQSQYQTLTIVMSGNNQVIGSFTTDADPTTKVSDLKVDPVTGVWNQATVQFTLTVTVPNNEVQKRRAVVEVATYQATAGATVYEAGTAATVTNTSDQRCDSTASASGFCSTVHTVSATITNEGSTADSWSLDGKFSYQLALYTCDDNTAASCTTQMHLYSTVLTTKFSKVINVDAGTVTGFIQLTTSGPYVKTDQYGRADQLLDVFNSGVLPVNATVINGQTMAFCSDFVNTAWGSEYTVDPKWAIVVDNADGGLADTTGQQYNSALAASILNSKDSTQIFTVHVKTEDGDVSSDIVATDDAAVVAVLRSGLSSINSRVVSVPESTAVCTGFEFSYPLNSGTKAFAVLMRVTAKPTVALTDSAVDALVVFSAGSAQSDNLGVHSFVLAPRSDVNTNDINSNKGGTVDTSVTLMILLIPVGVIVLAMVVVSFVVAARRRRRNN